MAQIPLQIENLPTLRCLLELEFRKRNATNPSYSMRSFAKNLGVPSSTLHAMMIGRIIGSPKAFEKISRKLEFSKAEVIYFETLSKYLRAKTASARAELLNAAEMQPTRFNSMPLNSFEELLKFWFCLPVMEIIKTKGSVPEPEWVARRLNISEIDAELALATLQVLKLIRIENRKVSVLRDYVSLPDQAQPPVRGLREYHKVYLQMAVAAVDALPAARRNTSTTVLRLRQEDRAEVDCLIAKFRRSLRKFERGEGHDSVYSLGMQFIRLDVDGN